MELMAWMILAMWIFMMIILLILMNNINSQNGIYFQRIKMCLMLLNTYLWYTTCNWGNEIGHLQLLKLIITKLIIIPQHISVGSELTGPKIKKMVFFSLSSWLFPPLPPAFLLFPFRPHLPSFRRPSIGCSNLRGYFCRLSIYTDRWTVLSECFAVAMRRGGNTMSAVNTSRLMAKRNK